jgi:hypothetical protein
MAPVSVRRVLGEMGARGFLTERSLTPDIQSLRDWSIDAIQVQTADLVRGPGDQAFEVALEPGSRRVFALPFVRLKNITLSFGAIPEARLEIFARVNGGREVLLGSLQPTSATAVVPSPSYRADAIIIAASAQAGAPSSLTRLTDLGVETQDGFNLQTSRLAAYLSQPAFQEIAPTPQIRVFRVMGARPLVSGKTPVERDLGPDPGGRLTFHSQAAQMVDVAVPFLVGWSGDVPLSDVSGRIRAQAPAQAEVHLRYAPRLFVPSMLVALLGFLSIAVLLRRPEIVDALLETGREEGK